jgi:hypothetical protein
MKRLDQPEVRQALLRRLRRLRPDSPRTWGRMSPHQMICHLCDSARMALGERTVSAATGAYEQTVLKWIALYAPLRWPPGIATRPEVDQDGRGTRPDQFLRDVETLVALTERLTRAGMQLDGREHPIFGRLSRAAWLRWAYLHMDHHLRQFNV